MPHYYTIKLHNMLNGIDIVYWINLDRSNGRRDNMTKIFEDDSFKDIKTNGFQQLISR